ncbi:hypothetical protein LTR85_003434 [Meristemomyces frigidus]|nr:hypothetical protein LTR85_003434 [Meristemomyces frigidus]
MQAHDPNYGYSRSVYGERRRRSPIFVRAMRRAMADDPRAGHKLGAGHMALKTPPRNSRGCSYGSGFSPFDGPLHIAIPGEEDISYGLDYGGYWGPRSLRGFEYGNVAFFDLRKPQ